MKILTKEEFLFAKLAYKKDIENNAIFIYPTDTIYGIGCDATSDEAVQKLRNIKQMPDKPISVIAPGKKWIRENCEIDEEWLDKLPGPYTLILKLKNKNCVSKLINPLSETIGVRIPNHWFSACVEECGKPICTTSANITGKAFMTNLNDLDKDIKKSVNFCIYEEEKKTKASKIIDLTQNEITIKER
tara:strand:- start:398 stop:961 length:564 start_codon:yes stop_codon:yes gene_type:complete